MIAILNTKGVPLNPTNNNGKIRQLLKDKKVKIIKREPLLTVQLLDDSLENEFLVSDVFTLGIDCGYSFVGFSVVNSTHEILGGELKLRNDISDLMDQRLANRRIKRSRLRYRQARYENRGTKKEGWLPPSIQHKLDSHINLIDKICLILPINNIVIETAKFDIQKIINPNIDGTDYQQGERYGHAENVREYVLMRDEHKCQICQTDTKSPKYNENLILRTHHIIFKSYNGTDKPNNLLTVCTNCHKPQAHKKGGNLYDMCMDALKGKLPILKNFKGETFMSIINKQIVDLVILKHLRKNVSITYGYITKSNRIDDNQPDSKVEKTHRTDAFYIAGGSIQTHVSSPKQIDVAIIRRNNRSLQTFTDSKWIDSRTGEKVSGNALNNGRTTRNKNLNTENLRPFRQAILKHDKKSGIMVRDKSSKGGYSQRTKRHAFQNGDLITFTENWISNDGTFEVIKNKIYVCGGTLNYGKRVYIKGSANKTSTVSVNNCKLIRSQKGFVYNTIDKPIKLIPIDAINQRKQTTEI